MVLISTSWTLCLESHLSKHTEADPRTFSNTLACVQFVLMPVEANLPNLIPVYMVCNKAQIFLGPWLGFEYMSDHAPYYLHVHSPTQIP